MTEEIPYVQIVGFPNYIIYDDGIVVNLQTRHVMANCFDSDGYHIVGLSCKNKVHTKKVHRLVAQGFLPDYSEKLQVDHINRVKTDNRVENLRMVTSKTNNQNRASIKGVPIHYVDQLSENCVEFQCYNNYQFGHYFIDTMNFNMYFDTGYQYKQISLIRLDRSPIYGIFNTDGKKIEVSLNKLKRGEYN